MKSTKALNRRRSRLLGQLSRLQMLIRGTLSDRYSVCIRPGCGCHEGAKHGPRRYITSGRIQSYVRNDQVRWAQEAIDQYQRAVGLLEAITEINLELLRRGELGGISGEDSSKESGTSQ